MAARYRLRGSGVRNRRGRPGRYTTDVALLRRGGPQPHAWHAATDGHAARLVRRLHAIRRREGQVPTGRLRACQPTERTVRPAGENIAKLEYRRKLPPNRESTGRRELWSRRLRIVSAIPQRQPAAGPLVDRPEPQLDARQ